MKTIAKRSVFPLVLACILLFGLLTFVVRYFLYADRWVSFNRSPHLYVYAEGEWYPDVGQVLDRSGTLLYSTTDGVRYAEDAMTRRSTVHLLGDRSENIPAAILRRYTPLLVGYDKINGTAAADQGWGRMTLTVDAGIQNVALQALGGRRGAVGVYNYRTGEILCAVTSPTFDPDDPPDLSEGEGDYEGLYYYRFFRSAYVPGSVFKLVTAAAALESLDDMEERSFTCTGEDIVNGQKVVCPKAHGELSFREALAKSCNCAFAHIALELGADALEDKAAEIGLEQSLDVDGIRTAPGNIDLSSGQENDLAWAAVGQHEDLINPCQYMMFMGALANGGKAAVPYLVSEVSCGGVVKYTAETAWTEKMLASSAARTLRGMMRYNVETVYDPYGTYFSGLEVCAKSGTAEGASEANTATFAGFVADEDYPLAFVIVIEEGGAGSAACVPVLSSVLQACKTEMDGER